MTAPTASSAAASDTAAPQSITIRRPDDWHVHLRDGDMLAAVAPYTARSFARAIVMPNLVPPVTTAAAGGAYRDRIMAALPDHPDFQPLMTAYLTDTIDAEELRRGKADGIFTAAKLYPAGATTNSDSGVTDVRNIAHVLEVMQEIGLPLLVHGEVTDGDVDIFDREAVFIDRILAPLVKDFPALRVVLEHITTKDAAQFVDAGPETLAATITPHHLMLDRNAIFEGGIRPHLYCLPILKRSLHRTALRAAATGKTARPHAYFLGTDSAPHAARAKEAACGCAGIFNAPHALEHYAQVFDEEDALSHFEAFASENGPAFYGMPQNEGTVTLSRTNSGAANAPASEPPMPPNPEAVVNFAGSGNLSWEPKR